MKETFHGIEESNLRKSETAHLRAVTVLLAIVVTGPTRSAYAGIALLIAEAAGTIGGPDRLTGHTTDEGAPMTVTMGERGLQTRARGRPEGAVRRGGKDHDVEVHSVGKGRLPNRMRRAQTGVTGHRLVGPINLIASSSKDLLRSNGLNLLMAMKV